MKVNYQYIEKDNNNRLFYASVIDGSLLIIYDKEVKCCGSEFTFAQSENLIKIHNNKFNTGQKTDIEQCGQPKERD